MRFDITEAAGILRLSHAPLYERMREGKIKAQKDGRHTFVPVHQPPWITTRERIEPVLTIAPNCSAV